MALLAALLARIQSHRAVLELPEELASNAQGASPSSSQGRHCARTQARYFAASNLLVHPLRLSLQVISGVTSASLGSPQRVFRGQSPPVDLGNTRCCSGWLEEKASLSGLFFALSDRCSRRQHTL